MIIIIILLLILAGASIATITGDKSITKNADAAVDAYKNSEEVAKEQEIIEGIDSLLQKYFEEKVGEKDDVTDPGEEPTPPVEEDTNPPIVTAKQESVTIEEGEIHELADYFKVEANGSNEDIQTVCTINEEVYENTETLTADGSPYTVKCTATKNGGESASETMTLVVEPTWKISVTEKQETLEATVMDSNTFDSLFTVTTKDGGTEGLTKTYTLNEEATSFSNTNELAIGTHTLTCTATYKGETDSARVTITVPKNYWVNDWESITIPERC